jgi:hypothetical protein
MGCACPVAPDLAATAHAYRRGGVAAVSNLCAASPHQFRPGQGASYFAMLPTLEDSPSRWFECASEMRALASAIRDPSVKLFALRVANDLDWFAECLALQEKRPETPA